MLGAIAGDIVGSIYESSPIKTKDFPLFGAGATFTDDSVCTVAVADWLLEGGDLAERLRRWVRRHPGRGYGGMFWMWALQDGAPAYGSWGNGAPMRVGPVAYVAKAEAEALELAERSARVTHDHPDAISGAQAVALAMWLARKGVHRDRLRRVVARRFGYAMADHVASLRRWYRFDISAKGTVPPALICALEATSYEDAVRNAISLGGDSDTLACITGGLAEILYGLPEPIAERALSELTPDLRAVVERFRARFPPPSSEPP